MKRVIVVRTDRLGDVLMSLPALALLRSSAPDIDITFACRADHHLVLRRFLAEMKINLVNSEELILNSGFYSGALFLNSDQKLAEQASKLRIPLRVGQRSKWWSFFTYTKSVRQRRSQSLQSEAEYNTDLAKVFLSELGIQPLSVQPIVLPVDEEAQISAKDTLKKVGIDPEKKFGVIHPGMGGSALNLSVAQWKQVIEGVREVVPIVLSFGPAPRDQKLRNELAAVSQELLVLPPTKLDTLAEIFRLSAFVVAPSTGPIHLAHLVGAATYGVYSPVLSHHPIRWAPFGGLKTAMIHTPAVKCPAAADCLGAKCNYYDCMDKTDWSGWLFQHLTRG